MNPMQLKGTINKKNIYLDRHQSEGREFFFKSAVVMVDVSYLSFKNLLLNDHYAKLLVLIACCNSIYIIV